MQSDEDELITLSKWPFYLGDILLVATALAIAIFQDWDLSTGQIAACVAAVALGAALFVLPYVLEYQIRIREEREDRSAELRVLQRQIKEHQSVLESSHARIVDLERELSVSAEATDVVAGAIEHKVAQIEAFEESQSAEIARIEKALAAVEAAATAVETDPEIAKSIEAIAEKLAELSKSTALTELANRVEVLENAPMPEPIIKEVPVSQADPDEAEDLEAVEQPTQRRPMRSPRKRRKPEARLLNRAIPEMVESASAVSRIITSKPKGELAEDVDPNADAAVEPESDASEAVEESSSKPEEAPTAKSPPNKDPILEIEVIKEFSDAFVEAPAVTPAPKKKKKKTDTLVTATIFIGIGNKPYIRGNGGGLNPEQGIPMEFMEIGKWSWSPEEALEGPLDLHIYRNDEEPDKNGSFTLNPREKLVVSPKF